MSESSTPAILDITARLESRTVPVATPRQANYQQFQEKVKSVTEKERYKAVLEEATLLAAWGEVGIGKAATTINEKYGLKKQINGRILMSLQYRTT